MGTPTKYQVFITPLIGENTYGDEIDVSELVLQDGLGKIKRGIDAQDYDIGVFTYSDLDIKCANVNGYFNDESDIRSIFTFSRDLARVRVVFTNDLGDSIVFRGLINEEATRVNVSAEDIGFRVLSLDSVIRNTQVSGGVVTSGVLASSAIFSILSDPKISSVLTVDVSNINPDTDVVIDDGSAFDNVSAKDALDLLLVATNSVIVIDSTDSIIVQSRIENTDNDILLLYGPYDLKRRQNVISLQDYNSGRHRMFTSFKVNDTEENNTALVETFGYRQKRVSLDFITDPDKESDIAAALLDQFSAPKIELTVDVPTYVARNVRILDRVSINWPLRLKTLPGKFLPIIGTAVIGDDATPLPFTYGNLSIPQEAGFKVIQIEEDTKEFITTLKLRQIGHTLSDGYFTSPGNAIVGFAIIGAGIIADGSDPDDMWNPSVVGAALIGSTMTE